MARIKSVNKPKQASAGASLRFWQRPSFFKWLVFLFPLLLFFNSVPNDYNLDDELVTINHRLTSKGVSAIPEIFSSPYYQDASGYSYEYRPVVLTSFAIEHQLFGDNAHISHFFNLLFYALCCLVLFNLLILILRSYSLLLALAITLLFAAHPAHTEVVCSIKNRDEILGLLFSLLSLIYAFRYAMTSRFWMLILGGAFFVLALLNKITMISFIVITPLAIIFFTRASVRVVISVVVLMFIPVFILLGRINGFDKLLMLAVLLISLITFHGIVYYEDSIKLLKTLPSRFAWFRGSDFSISDFDLIGYSGFRDFFSSILPQRELFSFQPIIYTGLVGGLYIAAIQRGYSNLGLIPLFILLGFSFYRDRRISFWSLAMLNVCLLFNLTLGKVNTSTNILFYRDWVSVFLILQLFLVARHRCFPALLGLWALIFINLFQLDDKTIFWGETFANDWASAILVLYVLLLRHRLGVNIYSFILLALVALFGYNSGQTLIPSGVVCLLLFAPYLRERARFAPLLCLMIGIGIFHVGYSYAVQAVHLQRGVDNIMSVANGINPKIVSSAGNRPIEYVERVTTTTDPPSIRIGTSLEILAFYLQKVIVPYPLAFYYGYRIIQPKKITDLVPLASLIIHLFLLLLAFVMIKRQPLISFGLFIYLISILVFADYIQPIPGMMGDRFLLVPSIGWSIILALILTGGVARISSATLAQISPYARYVFLGVLFIYAFASFWRNMDWKDYLTLFRHDITYVEGSSQAHNLLATRLMKTSFEVTDPAEQISLRREGLGHFKKALKIYPDFFNVAYDLGRTYATLNIMDSAVMAFDNVIRIDSDFSEAYFIAGDISLRQNNPDRSIYYLETYMRRHPENYTSYDRLSYIYFVQKKYEMAKEVSLRALRNTSQPNPDLYIVLGKISHAQNENDSAHIYLRKALELRPGDNNVQQLINDLDRQPPIPVK